MSELHFLLAAHRQIVPAGRVIDGLCRDAPPPRATGAVQVYVLHLRRRLGRSYGACDRIGTEQVDVDGGPSPLETPFKSLARLSQPQGQTVASSTQLP